MPEEGHRHLPPSSPGFTLKLSTGSLSVIAGDQTRLTISMQPRNGFSDTVTLSVSGLLPGVNASFTQNPLPTGRTSDLVIQTPIGSSGQNAKMERHRPCAKKQQNLVPGARIEPNSLCIDFRFDVAA